MLAKQSLTDELDLDSKSVQEWVSYLCQLRNAASKEGKYMEWCTAVNSEMIMLLSGETDTAAGVIMAATLTGRAKVLAKENNEYH